MSLEIESLTGEAVEAMLGPLAALRMAVFRVWPYLYDGSLAYEERYLATLAKAEGGLIVVARDRGAVIGCATAAPMVTQGEEIRAPIVAAGLDPTRVFYFGESVLMPEHRGRGIGHAFFDRREAHARTDPHCLFAVFASVVRSENHPLRDAGVRSLEPFWNARGYRPLRGVIGTLSWKDIGEPAETVKPMQIWIKAV